MGNLKQKESFLNKTCQNLIISHLKNMTKGHLSLTLPDGKNFIFGKDLKSPKAELKINHIKVFRDIILKGDIGFGESYVKGQWDTPCIFSVISWFILNIEQGISISGSQRKENPFINLFKFINKISHKLKDNTIKGSKKNIEDHYDISNEFYKTFLDKSMTYSCALFDRQQKNLESAQKDKYLALAKKLKISSSDHVLEIGTGWGGLSLFLAKEFGCKVTTITISNEQLEYSKDLHKKENVDHKIDLKLMDYRDLEGTFDKVISIEMIEAVGHKFYDTFFKKINEVLSPNGLIGLQVITSPHSRYKEFKKGIDWIQKHIFPGSLLPSVQTMNQSLVKNGGFELYSLKDMGQDYALTLNKWAENFNNNIDQIEKLGFSKNFIRKWNYYFKYCEAAFFQKNISVVQLIYSKPNNLFSHQRGLN